MLTKKVQIFGLKGEKGDIGPQGPKYVLTATDKQEIADVVAEEIISPIEAIIDESGLLE